MGRFDEWFVDKDAHQQEGVKSDDSTSPDAPAQVETREDGDKTPGSRDASFTEVPQPEDDCSRVIYADDDSDVASPATDTEPDVAPLPSGIAERKPNPHLRSRFKGHAPLNDQMREDWMKLIELHQDSFQALLFRPAMAFPRTMSGTQCAGAVNLSPSLRTKNPTAIVIRNAVRRLTPVESERLQGMPDGHTLIPAGKRKKLSQDEIDYLRIYAPTLSDEELEMLVADGHRYKAIGNSMAVPVMRWLMKGILAQLEVVINTEEQVEDLEPVRSIFKYIYSFSSRETVDRTFRRRRFSIHERWVPRKPAKRCKRRSYQFLPGASS